MNASGDLEYLGRKDSQIKIRGFRVELQEIECAVLKYENIKECCVIFEQNSLVCIYVQNTHEVNTEELHSFLTQNLLQHMIPQLYQYKEKSLPVTSNGKLDTKALRDFYRATNCSTKIHYTPPRNKLENEICKIFSAVLNLPKKTVGIDQDFFNIGGDSISSLLLAGKIQNQLGIKCNVKNIFDQRTVRRLCEYLGDDNSSSPKANGNNDALRPSGDVPLLPIQKWFFAKNLQCLSRWNQTFSIKVPQLDIQKLTNSLKILVNYHDAFRLRFRNGFNGYTQYYDDVENVDENFHQLDVNGLKEEEVSLNLTTWSTFNLMKGPLHTVVYLHNNESHCKIWWSIHHLIVDSVSWRIIKDDLKTLYEGGSLGAKGTSYKEFSLAMSNQFLPEKSYWDSIVEKVHLYNASFTETQHAPMNFKFCLDKKESQRLLGGQRREIKINIQDCLLTAVGYSLKKLTNSSLNYVTLEGHGREQIDAHLDLSNTVGWFTTMYPIEIHTDVNTEIVSNVYKAKKSLRSIPNKGIGYGVLYGYNDMPRVVVNFLGTFGNENSDTDWKFCDLSLHLSSDEREKTSSSVIDITGAFDQGRLKFSVDVRLEPSQSEIFVDNFKETLKEISRDLETCQPCLPFGDFEAYYEFPSEMKSNVTLFILPPGEGGAESYFNNLVPSLKQFNLVVFNNFYLERQPLEITFEELAPMYIQYIKKVQANGPYNLLGWSFGGVLALEISRQLTNSGDNVNNLFLIDSYLNVTKAVKDTNISDNTEVIDRINHKYTPTEGDFEYMCTKTKNIVLFKATLLNEMYKSRDQLRLYEYYMNTSFNNLDSVIPSHFITTVELERHTHNTWAKNNKQVILISNVVADKLIFNK